MYGGSPDPWDSPRLPYLPKPTTQGPLLPQAVTLDAKQFGELMDELRTLRHAVDRLTKDVAALQKPKRKARK